MVQAAYALFALCATCNGTYLNSPTAGCGNCGTEATVVVGMVVTGMITSHWALVRPLKVHAEGGLRKWKRMRRRMWRRPLWVWGWRRRMAV
ncbi:hypothetical protein BJ165DRAFT_1615307 [Panaeolus papilionaceus]|nr:hypothetical protein BJ165DRAFT_1615307 [Panaeolus papilionaceus]